MKLRRLDFKYKECEMKGKGTFAVGAILAFVMLVVTAVGAFAWHGTTEVHVDCSGWNVEVNTTWVDDEGVPHVGTITASSNLSGSWAPGQTSVNWFVEVTWFDEEGNVIDTWPDGGTINKPSCPTATPPPTNTPTPTATDTPEPENEPPVCQLSYGPGEGTAPLTVNFDASGSHDPDGFIEHWQWTFGDGESRPGGAKESHVYDRPGVYYGNLVVSDDDGVTSFCTFEVRVTAPPTPTATKTSVPTPTPIFTPTATPTEVPPTPTPTEIVIQDLSGGASCGGADVNNPNNAEAHIVIRVDGKEVIDGFAPANQTTFFPWPQPVVDFAEHSAEMSWWIYGDDGLADLGSFGPCETAQDLSATPSCKGVEVTNPNKSEAHIIVQVDDKAVIDSFAPANSTKFFAWPEPYDDPEVHAVMLDFWVWDHFAWVDIGNIGPCGTQPNPTPTSPPEEEIEVAAAAVKATCALEPVLREVWNPETHKWDIYWWEYNTTTNSLDFVKNLTEMFDGNFRNPTVRLGNCRFAVEQWGEDGRHEVRLYDFAMTLHGRIWNETEQYLMPEYVLESPGDKLVLVRESDGALIVTNEQQTVWEVLPAEGRDPHSLVTNSFIVAYTNEAGKLVFVTSEGESLLAPDVRCDRPEWKPDGSGVYCRVGFNLMLYSYPRGELLELHEGFFGAALDPDNSGRAVFSGPELLFVENVEAATLSPDELSDMSGWGSDWGDQPVTPDLSAFEAQVQTLQVEAVTEEGGSTKVVEPVCPDYEGDSIVDCLVAAGMDSSFAARAQLAVDRDIVDSVDDYVGSAEQNTLLLEELVLGGRG